MNGKSISIGGYKHPPVAILQPNSLKACNIPVAILKILYQHSKVVYIQPTIAGC